MLFFLLLSTALAVKPSDREEDDRDVVVFCSERTCRKSGVIKFKDQTGTHDSKGRPFIDICSDCTGARHCSDTCWEKHREYCPQLEVIQKGLRNFYSGQDSLSKVGQRAR